MVSKIITVAFLVLFSVSLYASPEEQEQTDNHWVGDWWTNVYELNIKPQQQQAIRNDLTECEIKLNWYSAKVKANPKSEYFKYKFEDWAQRCSTPQSEPNE